MIDLHAEILPLWHTIDNIPDSNREYLKDVVVVSPDLAAHLRIRADLHKAIELCRLELFGSCDD